MLARRPQVTRRTRARAAPPRPARRARRGARGRRARAAGSTAPRRPGAAVHRGQRAHQLDGAAAGVALRGATGPSRRAAVAAARTAISGHLEDLELEPARQVGERAERRRSALMERVHADRAARARRQRQRDRQAVAGDARVGQEPRLGDAPTRCPSRAAPPPSPPRVRVPIRTAPRAGTVSNVVAASTGAGDEAGERPRPAAVGRASSGEAEAAARAPR